MSIEDKVRGFVVEIQDGQATGEIPDDLAIIEVGLIDSLAILQLVSYLEDEFGIAVADDDLVADHFGTVSAIAAFVRSRQAAL
jgi:acyl carrier protein